MLPNCCLSVGSVPTKLRDNGSGSDSGVGDLDGSLNLRRDVVFQGCLRHKRGRRSGS